MRCYPGYSSGLAGTRLRLEQQARIVPIGAAGSADPAGDDGEQREGSSEAECTTSPRNGVVALPKWAAAAPSLAWLWLEAGVHLEPLFGSEHVSMLSKLVDSIHTCQRC